MRHKFPGEHWNASSRSSPLVLERERESMATFVGNFSSVFLQSRLFNSRNNFLIKKPYKPILKSAIPVNVRATSTTFVVETNPTVRTTLSFTLITKMPPSSHIFLFPFSPFGSQEIAREKKKWRARKYELLYYVQIFICMLIGMIFFGGNIGSTCSRK